MNQVSELEEQLVMNKALVNKGKALTRLMSNRDFKSLILEGFCFEEAARSIKLSANTLLSESGRNECIRQAQAAGYLELYLELIKRDAKLAENTIVELNDSIDEARAEEV